MEKQACGFARTGSNPVAVVQFLFFWFYRVALGLENSLAMGWDQVLLVIIHERDLEGYQIRHSGK